MTMRTSLHTDATSRHRGKVWLWQRQMLRKQRQTCKRDMLISAGRYRDEDHQGTLCYISLVTLTERERALLALLAQEDICCAYGSWPVVACESDGAGAAGVEAESCLADVACTDAREERGT